MADEETKIPESTEQITTSLVDTKPVEHQIPALDPEDLKKTPDTLPSADKSRKLLILAVVFLILIVIGGVAYFMLVSKKQMDAESPSTPTPQPMGNDGLDGGWKTYVDTKNNIAFDYPNNLIFDKDSNSRATFFDNQEYLDKCKANPEDGTDSCLKAIFSYNGFEIAKKPSGLIEPSSYKDGMSRDWTIESIEVEGSNNIAAFSVIDKKNVKLTLRIQLSSSKILLNQILSTFKFVTDTSDWKTISSKKVGYSIKVPKSWELLYTEEDDSLLKTQDYVVNTIVKSEKGYDPGPAESINAITVLFPITIAGPHYDVGNKFENGLEGLAKTESNEKAEFTTISGYKTLLKTISPVELPDDWVGDGCVSCTTKIAYIDVGGKIIDIHVTWEHNTTELEKTFDEIITTFKYTK